jgi:lipopolysaccharide transport protein LptA
MLWPLIAISMTANPIEVKADSLQVFSTEKRALYTGHAVAKRSQTTITCDQIEVRLGKTDEIETVIADGHVVATEGDREVTGTHAIFNNTTGVMTLTGNPKGKQGFREVTGDEVVFTTGTDVLQVKNPHTVIDDLAHPEKKMIIDSDSLVLDSNRSVAKWKGHVVAKRGTTTITAPELDAHYDEKGQVTRVLAANQVEATDGDRWAKGKKANYDVANGTLVLTGNPEATQGANRMRGSKVIFYLSSNKLEVENATTVFSKPTKGKMP